MLFLIIFGLIVYLIILAFRYKSVKANAFSRKEMEEAAHRQANKLSYKDPMITCDYCGAKIDTRKHKVCPQCGAAFDQDREWTQRHDAGDRFIDEGTREIVAEREKKSKEESQKILNRMKKTMVLLSILIGVMIALVIIVGFIDKQSSYRKSEKLEDIYSLRDFTPADYEVVGDGVVFDQNGMRIRVTGFYVDPYTEESTDFGEDFNGDVAVEFVLENHTKTDYDVVIHCESFDGITYGFSRGFFVYDTFKRGSDVVFYERLNNVPLQKVTEMVIEDIHMYGDDSTESMELDAPVVIQTTAQSDFKPDMGDKNLVFTNDYVDIYAEIDEADDRYYWLFIQNKTEEVYMISGEEQMFVDGKPYEDSTFYKRALPGGYLFAADYIKPTNTGEDDIHLDGREVQIGITFRCEHDPHMDFSTGYIELSKPIETEAETTEEE
ncbi:MAG: hypothetical protein IKR14_01190 [Lachnospiraceae bacterium]|nr:hypothetical protein [Lachnospiraceae bacterium]